MNWSPMPIATNPLPWLAWIGLGANLGDPILTFGQALHWLQNDGRICVMAISPCYATAPVGVSGQSWFLNGVAAIRTDLPPASLLARLLWTERRFGRRRPKGETKAPRPLDLDLLLYDEVVICRRGMTIPHPRLHLRRFVLQPLADLAPGLIHPSCAKTIDTLLQEVKDIHPVIRLADRGVDFPRRTAT